MFKAAKEKKAARDALLFSDIATDRQEARAQSGKSLFAAICKAADSQRAAPEDFTRDSAMLARLINRRT